MAPLLYAFSSSQLNCVLLCWLEMGHKVFMGLVSKAIQEAMRINEAMDKQV